jgi:hypothetical protein
MAKEAPRWRGNRIQAGALQASRIGGNVVMWASQHTDPQHWPKTAASP